MLMLFINLTFTAVFDKFTDGISSTSQHEEYLQVLCVRGAVDSGSAN